MATPTDELEYPGSLEQVRAFMDRLLGGAGAPGPRPTASSSGSTSSPVAPGRPRSP